MPFQVTQITIQKCFCKNVFTPRTIYYAVTRAKENDTEISSFCEKIIESKLCTEATMKKLFVLKMTTKL